MPSAEPDLGAVALGTKYTPTYAQALNTPTPRPRPRYGAGANLRSRHEPIGSKNVIETRCYSLIPVR